MRLLGSTAATITGADLGRCRPPAMRVGRPGADVDPGTDVDDEKTRQCRRSRRRRYAAALVVPVSVPMSDRARDVVECCRQPQLSGGLHRSVQGPAA